VDPRFAVRLEPVDAPAVDVDAVQVAVLPDDVHEVAQDAARAAPEVQDARAVQREVVGKLLADRRDEELALAQPGLGRIGRPPRSAAKLSLGDRAGGGRRAHPLAQRQRRQGQRAARRSVGM